MPELPEVESARAVIERAALGRRIVDVDDTDTYVCRPHRPGQIRAALLGRTLTVALRRGKSMWCDTSPVAAADPAAAVSATVTAARRAGAGAPVHGPVLGIHLGMSGKIVVADASGTELDGGDYWERGRKPGDYRFQRFALTFDDGGRMMLIDPRRLGRVRLDPPVELLGPDAALITPAQFRAAVARGTIAVKARLLDQTAIAGIGNLLADDLLWQARINPSRPVDELTDDDVRRLLRATRKSVSSALRDGGVHTLPIVPYRKSGALCPRDGAAMARSTVGGRTSWWCAREQRR